MEFRPDVLVMEPDHPALALVAEVKASVPDLKGAEGQLKEYMSARQCPVGMIVTPERTWVYHDTFADGPHESIERIGEFVTADLLRLPSAPSDERALTHAVRTWLERVASSWMDALPPSVEVRRSLLTHLVPAVMEGRVSSGGLLQ
jgi:hypothetical protein